MDSKFWFLIENAELFTLNIEKKPDKLNQALTLSQKYGCENSPVAVKRFLKEKLRNSIYGKEPNLANFIRFERFVALSYYAGNDNLKALIQFLETIRNYVNQVDQYSETIEDWIAASDILRDLLTLNDWTEDSLGNMYKASQLVSTSIRYLRALGYCVNIESSGATMPRNEEDRLIEHFKNECKSLGFWATKLCLTEIQKKYNSANRRYYFNYEPSVNKPDELQIPWGYILKLSLSYYKPTPKSNKTQIRFDRLVESITYYLALYELQDLRIVRFDTQDTIISTLKKYFIYDNLYSVYQVNPVHYFIFISGILNQIPSTYSDVRICIDIFAMFLDKNSPGDITSLRDREILQKLKDRYTDEIIRRAKKNLSFASSEINTHYGNPGEVSSLNHFQKPLIRVGDQYLCLNMNFFCSGFLFSICEELKVLGFDTAKIGTLAENFLVAYMRKKGLTVSHGRKYAVSKQDRKAIGTTREEGECDIIVETATKILFIEVKKKPLTAASISGNSIQGIQDLSQSVFHGLSQSGWHELLLRTHGKISFKDGTILHLQDREVERATVSVFDYYSLDDSHFVHDLLNNFIGAKFTSPTHEIPKDLHKYLDQLSTQYSHPIFMKQYMNQINPFRNCSFFSVFQIMVVLDQCNNNEQFLIELFSARAITTNGRDWYRDYFYKKDLELFRDTRKLPSEANS